VAYPDKIHSIWKNTNEITTAVQIYSIYSVQLIKLIEKIWGEKTNMGIFYLKIDGLFI